MFRDLHTSVRTRNLLAGSNQDIVISELFLIRCIGVCLLSLFENITENIASVAVNYSRGYQRLLEQR